MAKKLVRIMVVIIIIMITITKVIIMIIAAIIMIITYFHSVSYYEICPNTQISMC